ncbi:MAG: transposase [Candidatus Eisenbacteria sp.]|nr:transposase [Candidatus Eisenbacteria bacterium]
MSEPSDSAARWRGIVRGQAQSGLSVAAYCRRRRVPQSSFYAWRRKLRDAAGFAEVRVAPGSAVAGSHPNDAAPEIDALEVRLPNGRGIVVRPGFDRQTLQVLLDTLENGVTRTVSGVAGVTDRGAGV